MPEARGKTSVVDSGVDLERFVAVAPVAELEHPAFVHVGSLTERKNVVAPRRRVRAARPRLADVRRRRPAARQARGDATASRVVGRVRARRRAGVARAADVVCGPALIEPFGQALLEAMACGPKRRRDPHRRPAGVRPAATPGCSSTRSTSASLRARSRPLPSLPSPERGRARGRGAARPQDCRRLGWRRFCCEPFEIGQPDLDERPDRLVEPVLARQLERPLVALRGSSRGETPCLSRLSPVTIRSWIFWRTSSSATRIS